MIIDDLKSIIDVKAHLQHITNTVYIEENSPEAKLRRVSVQARSTEYVAFKLDFERNIICKRKSTSCAAEKARCNDISSRICTIFNSNPGLHKGCDAIICEHIEDTLYFYVIELKSYGPKLTDVGLQFAASVSFIDYVCSILKYTFGHSDFKYSIYCSLMWLKNPTPKQVTKQSLFDYKTLSSVRINVRPLSSPRQYADSAFQLSLLPIHGRDFIPPTT